MTSPQPNLFCQSIVIVLQKGDTRRCPLLMYLTLVEHSLYPTAIRAAPPGKNILTDIPDRPNPYSPYTITVYSATIPKMFFE